MKGDGFIKVMRKPSPFIITLMEQSPFLSPSPLGMGKGMGMGMGKEKGMEKGMGKGRGWDGNEERKGKGIASTLPIV